MTENSSPHDYYAVLGVDRDATAAQIKFAYYRLAKQHHPDKKGPNFDGDSSEFREIHEAYETLYDATSREKYDEDTRMKTSNATSQPFNIFHPRKSHPNAKFHDTATEFTEEQPDFANAHKSKDSWNSQNMYSSSAPRGIPTAHGLRVHMTGHPAASTAGRKCPFMAEEWRKQPGTDVCIFCLTLWQGAHRCPACEAVACSSCLEEIKDVVSKKPNSWFYGPQARPSGG